MTTDEAATFRGAHIEAFAFGRMHVFVAGSSDVAFEEVDGWFHAREAMDASHPDGYAQLLDLREISVLPYKAAREYLLSHAHERRRSRVTARAIVLPGGLAARMVRGLITVFGYAGGDSDVPRAFVSSLAEACDFLERELGEEIDRPTLLRRIDDCHARFRRTR